MSGYDIVIVGGGAAGMMAAVRCAGKRKRVIVLEKNSECGKKLLITGKGRCNITNTAPWTEFQGHIHPNKSFVKNAFYHFSNEAVVSFFEGMGMMCKVERGNRVFPVSDRSRDVRDSLVNYLAEGGVVISYGCEVIGVEREGGTDPYYDFAVRARTSDGENICLKTKKIILTTGGLSYPSTGSTGDGYSIARSLGHNIVDTFPSLTALKPAVDYSDLEGLLLKNIKLDLWVNGSIVQSEFGETQFTSGGIEGALGFRVSRKGVKAMINGQKVEVVIDLKPAVEVLVLQNRINQIVEDMGKGVTPRKVLLKLLPAQMVDYFIASSSGMNFKNMADFLKNWRFRIVDYVGYERSVITAGGVSLEEVSRKTMESKLVKGLYFAGEVLDVDGDTGGYNLQIAFSTGALAGDSAINSLAI
jgi:predicted Rossmann fold flavoprotein